MPSIMDVAGVVRAAKMRSKNKQAYKQTWNGRRRHCPLVCAVAWYLVEACRIYSHETGSSTVASIVLVGVLLRRLSI
jgi:hypothetical protein